MKKVLSFFGAALFVAAMTVSCGNNNTEATDSVCDSTVENAACCDEQAAQPVEAVAMTDAEHQAMLDAAAEAGRAKCNCYKTDAASVEACINGILAQSYAAYQDNEEFKAAMEAEFNSCVKEKASAAIKDATKEGVKELAKGVSGALKK